MQIPLAHMDSAVLEEVSIPLWTELFEAVGWPSSLQPRRPAPFSHEDLLNALLTDQLNDELLLALETLQNLGTPAGRETISAVMSDRHVPLDALPYDIGERELALRLFLKQREDAALAEVFARAQIQVQEGDHRRFNDFIGKSGRRIANPGACRVGLETEILNFCKQSDLGEHVQVRFFGDEDGTCCFQVMRSHRTRTPLAVLPGTTGRATIKYRPVHADLIRYEASLGRLRVTARAVSMVEVYRRAFGRVLFGDDAFFYGDPVCSLRVLQDEGRRALERHRVFGVGRVWMTQCLWERGDGQRVTIQAADCFSTIDELKLNLGEGELLQAKLKMEVTGRSSRPVIVNVRAPSRIEISQAQHEVLVNEVLDAVGIRSARRPAPDVHLWSMYPWRQPVDVWRTLFQGDVSPLISQGVLNKVQLDSVADRNHPGAGRVLRAEPVAAGDFVGISQAPEVPSRSLSATDLDGLELAVEPFQTHVRGLLGLEGTVEMPSDDGLLDLGVLSIGDLTFRLTYALRQPPSTAAAVVNARAAGARPVILLPTAGNQVPGIATVVLDRPLPARNALVRAIAAALNLTEALPAVLTAPEKARLIIDTRRGIVWFDGVEIPDLKPDTHQFSFTHLLATRAPALVPKDEVVTALSYGRSDGDQAARSAKTKAKKALTTALLARGMPFVDPFKTEGGGYRLTVCAHVV